MAADDLEDADALIRGHAGFENDPHGAVIGRAFRTIKKLALTVRDLEQRVAVLEAERPEPPPPEPPVSDPPSRK